MIANAGIGTNGILHESEGFPDLKVGGLHVLILPLDVIAPTEDLDRLLDINVKGTFFSYKYAAMQLIKQGGGGRLIGAASVAGKKGKSLPHSGRAISSTYVHAMLQEHHSHLRTVLLSSPSGA